MPSQRLFSTRIYAATLMPKGAGRLNRELGDTCAALALEDTAGQAWSRQNYLGGYTSYGTHCRMHLVSPAFAQLERMILPHVNRYVRELGYDMRRRRVFMTDCWVNIMPAQVMHGSHIHPQSFISGTYYVQTPPGAAPLKFEDPRLGFMMGTPPRRTDAPRDARIFHRHRARAGEIVLFESWLRHEVPASAVRGERISISFNYGWEGIPGRQKRG